MTRYKFWVTERSINPPGQDLGGKRRLGLNFNDLADLPPDPLRKIRKIDVRADALMFRQRPLQMAGDCSAGNDDLLWCEGPGGFLCETFK